MRTQNVLSLKVSRIPGETNYNLQTRQLRLDGALPERAKVPTEKLLCDALKRLARSAMATVTECAPVSLPVALAGLNQIRELMILASSHELIPGSETLRSSAQLSHPATLADLLACVEITRKEFRAPVFLNNRDAEIEKLRKDFSQLAGLVCMALPKLQMPEVFCNQEITESDIVTQCLLYLIGMCLEFKFPENELFMPRSKIVISLALRFAMLFQS